MKYNRQLRLIFGFFTLVYLGKAQCYAQTDLLNELDQIVPSGPDYVTATFKSSRVINGHSVEQVSAKHLDFRISHRFGQINSGAYNLFGLDNAVIRLGLEYGITDNLMIGIGRSSFQKTFDGFVKARMLRQTKDNSMPVTVSVFAGSYFASLKASSAEEQALIKPTDKLSYATQLLIARKFGERLSLQLSPTLIHRNMVELKSDHNTSTALGFGGRFKLTKRVSVNGEYFLQNPNTQDNGTNSSFSIGFDIETGGHVFQLHLTNSRSMIERGFVAQTVDTWGKGGIFYGFNISRTFSFDKK